MATTNNVIIPNVDPVDASNPFPHFWALTRAMMKAGWKYLASGNDDTGVKDTSADPELDSWISWSAGTISNAGGATAEIAAPSRGRALITGLSGIVNADKGRFLHINGSGDAANNHYHQIEEIVSATSVKIDARTFVVSADSALDWEIRDPTLATIPGNLNTNYGWWLARGPSTLLIPIAAAPVAGSTGLLFVRGENVTQSTTGAQGELIGYVYHDSYGYLVIGPRVRGTGTGLYGWDSTYTITGNSSAATVTQSGDTVEQRAECVIHKVNNANTGNIYHGTFDPVIDYFDSFSNPTRLSGATDQRAPGQNSDFPTSAYVSLGQLAYNSGTRWDCHTSARVIGHGQIMCADCIEEDSYSADGSWTVAMAENTASTGTHIGHAFLRLDNTEPGDPYLYVAFNSNASGNLYATTRTTAAGHASGLVDCFTVAAWSGSTTARRLFGWILSEGMTIKGHTEFEMAFLRGHQSSTTMLMSLNGVSPIRISSNPANTKAREPIWIIYSNGTSAYRMYKGTVRWWSAMQGYGRRGLDLWDSATLVQLSPTDGAFIVGPWDGVSVPTRT